MYKFAAASAHESIVFGAARPGYSDARVNQWIEHMQRQEIQHVCCLLASAQLNRYGNLLDIYRQRFGSDRVCWAPIEDFQLVEGEILAHRILPFLSTANQRQEKVVVHCSGGVGRTGQVLAAWLVYRRGFSVREAISTVNRTGRNPDEAAIMGLLKGQNPWKIKEQFNTLLKDVQDLEHELP